MGPEIRYPAFHSDNTHIHGTSILQPPRTEQLTVNDAAQPRMQSPSMYRVSCELVSQRCCSRFPSSMERQLWKSIQRQKARTGSYSLAYSYR